MRYGERAKIIVVKDIEECFGNVQVLLKSKNIQELGQTRKKRLVVTAFDDSGTVQLGWFKGVKWSKSAIKVGEQYVVFGKPNFYGGTLNFNHPEIELEEKNKNKVGNLQPVYHSTEKLSSFGLQSKGIENLMRNL